MQTNDVLQKACGDHYCCQPHHSLVLLSPRLYVRPPWPRETPDKDEVRHVFFLKVHKAASTTVMGIMFRFALDRKLDVLVPREGNFLSETRQKSWTSIGVPLPKGRTRYDILCNHVVFHEKSIMEVMYSDVKFLAIVRYPFNQFLSAFQFFRPGWKYLRMISGPNPLATYFQNPDLYEPPNPRESFTNNRMSVDFGMDPSRLEDRDYVRKYIGYLGKVFDLVLVMELFDESVIAMRRLLQWRLQDVVYIPVNTQRHNIFL
ncbi:hypothetical protein C0Q70_09310 [Pomacea canaliculata]|uniref:Uncharacterized protein n=1 Tax=Pomacea canaliculata TaxID=400727 RepID=A0A2T7P9F9_POMCA|nr:hypothetical protein C0Q70_09310 [Pomacea canaliculata]